MSDVEIVVESVEVLEVVQDETAIEVIDETVEAIEVVEDAVEVVEESFEVIEIETDPEGTETIVTSVEVIEVVDEGPQGPRGVPGTNGGTIAPVYFSFGDATPDTIYTTDSAGTVVNVRLIVDTAFDGAGASISLGTTTDPDLLLDEAENDPSVASEYESTPDVVLTSGTAVRLSITPGAGATQGAGRILLTFIPNA